MSGWLQLLGPICPPSLISSSAGLQLPLSLPPGLLVPPWTPRGPSGSAHRVSWFLIQLPAGLLSFWLMCPARPLLILLMWSRAWGSESSSRCPRPRPRPLPVMTLPWLQHFALLFGVSQPHVTSLLTNCWCGLLEAASFTLKDT